MLKHRLAAFALLVAAGAPAHARAQGHDPAALLAAQRTAMARLSNMDGVWRGPAWTLLPNGTRLDVTHTERAGPFLDGAVKVLEGRGYDAGGAVAFNAFATISYDPATQVYSMRSYAQGRSGDFVLTPTANGGYTWEIPAGPMIIRYTATIRDGVWREVGDRIMPGREPVRFVEMNLRRVGDTDWPAAGAVSAH
ncbi:MAG TPA: hypothetical protein VEX86_10120 [Longimicrobium sp.]|nr:hypothetical protein [Longimicrobium sp.]